MNFSADSHIIYYNLTMKYKEIVKMEFIKNESKKKNYQKQKQN